MSNLVLHNANFFQDRFLKIINIWPEYVKRKVPYKNWPQQGSLSEIFHQQNTFFYVLLGLKLKILSPEILKSKNHAGQSALTLASRYDKKMVELILKCIGSMNVRDQIEILNLREDICWLKVTEFKYERESDSGPEEYGSCLIPAGEPSTKLIKWNGCAWQDEYTGTRRNRLPLRTYQHDRKDINAGPNALYLAMLSSDAIIIKLMLNHIKKFSIEEQIKILKNNCTRSPLELAASTSEKSAIELILDHLKNNFPEKKQLQLIKIILRILGKDCNEFFSSRKNRELLKLVLNHVKSFSPKNKSKIFSVNKKGILYDAISENNYEKIKAILENIKELDSKLQIDIMGSDILLNTCKCEVKNKIFKLILDHIKLLKYEDRLKILNSTDESGQTPWAYCQSQFFKGNSFLARINDLKTIDELNIISIKGIKINFILAEMVNKRIKILNKKLQR